MAHTHWDVEECGGDDNCDSIEIEPECVCGLSHRWTREGEGGCTSNPGVWSLGGTSYQFVAHCRLCGCRRTTVSVGSQRNPGECDQVSYETGEVDELAVTAERRRLRRNRLARERRAQRRAHPVDRSSVD